MDPSLEAIDSFEADGNYVRTHVADRSYLLQ